MTESDKNANLARPGVLQSLSDIFVTSRLPGAKLQVLFWGLLAASLGLDLCSKSAVFNWLKDRGSVSIIPGFLQFIVTENAGAAFGIASGKRFLLLVISFLALAAILGIFLFGKTERKLIIIAISLFAAGVCGNLYDRIFNEGLVRDFIDIYWGRVHWPAFNVADSVLCIAVGLLIISSFRKEK
jgi:signal peptidase II